MAYVVPRGGGAWEIRESRTTAAGPRSRTLATFRTLTPEIVERARDRSSRPLDAGDLRRLARRAGAPVDPPPGDRVAAELLAELAAGRRPRAVLARLLSDALRADTLQAGDGQPNANAEAAGAWIAASSTKRGETLHDLLLLVDRLPRTRAPERARFPRIASHPA